MLKKVAYGQSGYRNLTHATMNDSSSDTGQISALKKLIELLILEPRGGDSFVGGPQDLGWGNLFGGHVLGQGIMAASSTCSPEFIPHSLRATFLETGRTDRPLLYQVHSLRNGKSFLTRRVAATQNKRLIFECTISFHLEEWGLEHQDKMPPSANPDSLKSEQELAKMIKHKLPAGLAAAAEGDKAIELRPVSPNNPYAPGLMAPLRQVWLRATDKIPEVHNLQYALLAYASDFSLITTALLPHGISWLTPGIRMASLDHGIWFHRPLDLARWHLHDMQSTTAQGARGFSRGQIFNEAGQLIASTAQEGLMRISSNDYKNATKNH